MVSAPMTLADLLGPALAVVPDRPAVVVQDEVVSYADLDVLSDRVRASLLDAKMEPSQVAAIVDRGSVFGVAALVGVARAGAVSAQVNPGLTSGEMSSLFNLVNARAALTTNELRQEVAGAIDGPLITPSDLPSGRAGATVLDQDGGPALILFSSGTTGLPKPVEISNAVISDRLRYYGAPVDSEVARVDMMTVPVFHIGGSLGLLITLYSGRTMVIMPEFRAAEWLRVAEKYRVRQTFVVPTMLRRILDDPAFPSTDLSALEDLSYGAAPATIDLIQRALEALPKVNFMNVFGQTETLGAYAALGPVDHRNRTHLDSVGQPFPGVEVRIVEVGTDRDVPDGEVGEVWVKAAQNVTGDWLPTGDLARRDADGYLYVRGRTKDTINRGGEKISPTEIEESLRDLPGVMDVAVAGLPDPDLGEKVGALIVAEGVDEAAVARHCEGRLARFKRPAAIVFCDHLPYNTFGKLPRRAVADAIQAAIQRTQAGRS